MCYLMYFVLFQIETRVSPRHFVSFCLYKCLFNSNLLYTFLNIIGLTFLVTVTLFTMS